MIIWSGLGILIPLVAVVGIAVSTVLFSALGLSGVGPGFGFILAAIANWGLWKLIYPKNPKILIDPSNGQQVVIKPRHGLFFIPAKAWTWIFGLLALPVLGMGFIAEQAETENAKIPGYSQFKIANDQIASKSEGNAHGNTGAASEAASRFSVSMKKMTDALFTGGSKKNLMTGGNFLTFCQEGGDTIVFLCHVPSLRSYKSDDATESLNEIAWIVATQTARIMDPEHKKKLVVGLRGITNYSSIQTGASGPEAKTPELLSNDASELYGFFVDNAPTIQTSH